MDREYLLRRRDQELVKARRAASPLGREGHLNLAQAFLTAAGWMGPAPVISLVSHD
jgi:hypothetical protein